MLPRHTRYKPDRPSQLLVQTCLLPRSPLIDPSPDARSRILLELSLKVLVGTPSNLDRASAALLLRGKPPGWCLRRHDALAHWRRSAVCIRGVRVDVDLPPPRWRLNRDVHVRLVRWAGEARWLRVAVGRRRGHRCRDLRMAAASSTRPKVETETKEKNAEEQNLERSQPPSLIHRK